MFLIKHKLHFKQFLFDSSGLKCCEKCIEVVLVTQRGFVCELRCVNENSKNFEAFNELLNRGLKGI